MRTPGVSVSKATIMSCALRRDDRLTEKFIIFETIAATLLVGFQTYEIKA